jgi:conjugative relaxase-like TrwC/TraI family protein
MLRVSVHEEAGAAKSYYSSGEYYAKGLEMAGAWGGLSAERLGLGGEVAKGAFHALCDNKDPRLRTPLTLRTRRNRRVLFDFNFHVPKTVSIVYGFFGDEAILRALHAAVSETMAEIEADVRTRVRKAGVEDTRQTGNIVFARFVHTTTRPVDGVPDPHLHAHCCVFNATFDPAEGSWKALELGDVYQSLPYYEALFHSRLAGSLRLLGFDVSATRTGWEISGVPDRVLKLFSRRTARIEALARQLGVTDPRAKDKLGARTRERKRRNLSLYALRDEWRSRLTGEELSALRAVNEKRVPRSTVGPTVDEALRWAVEHVFEREAVVRVRRLLAAVLRRGVGWVSVGDLRAALPRHGLIIREQRGQSVVTTEPVLLEELRMLRFARSGRGRCLPLVLEPNLIRDGHLGTDQRAAVRHLVNSRDRVMILRGAAGTGKTALMRAAVGAIEASGKRVITLAPSAVAGRGVLRGEGFSEADTVARFLVDERWQREAAGQVLWVDEAGLLGTRAVTLLFRLAERLGIRVILSGDVRQHGPVDRGLPLRILQTEAGLVAAEVNTIRRQRGEYREAVRLLGAGRTAEGFDRLVELGWVREVSGEGRNTALAREYEASVSSGKSTLVVAPTHLEGEAVTTRIREVLLAAGRLGRADHAYTRLEAKLLTVAERQLGSNFEEGDVVEFQVSAPGFRRGTRYVVSQAGAPAVVVRDPRGFVCRLPLGKAERFSVYTPRPITLSVGERVRVTKNGWSIGRDRRLDNGWLDTVSGFTKKGEIEFESGALVPPDYGHLTYGYVITSHASQGKTVDRVVLAASSDSFTAVGREQLYVSISRGREMAMVFTDDLDALRQAVQRSDPRTAAVDAVREREPGLSRWESWLLRNVGSITPRTGQEQGAAPVRLSPQRVGGPRRGP